MRVAYLVSQYPAPSHTFIRREIDALRARGVDIRIISIRQPAEEEILSAKDQASFDETYYVFPPRPLKALSALAQQVVTKPHNVLEAARTSATVRLPGTKNSTVYQSLYFLEGAQIAKEFERQGIEHVHCHFSNAASHAAMAAAEISGKSFSLTIHGLGDFDYPGAPTLREKLKRARFIASATQYGIAQAMRLTEPEDWSKLHLVRCGIEVDKLPARAPRPEGSRYRFVCVSRISAEKGQLGLVEAFARAKSRGLDAELVLVGDGPMREPVEARIRELGIEGDVQLRGRLAEEDTLKEVAAADATIIASFMEGLPVAIMESLGIGVPVIAPRITGIPELVVDGETGWLFTAASWDELADRMLEASQQRDRADAMAEAGRKRVLEEFDVDQAVAKLAGLFG